MHSPKKKLRPRSQKSPKSPRCSVFSMHLQTEHFVLRFYNQWRIYVICMAHRLKMTTTNSGSATMRSSPRYLLELPRVLVLWGEQQSLCRVSCCGYAKDGARNPYSRTLVILLLSLVSTAHAICACRLKMTTTNSGSATMRSSPRYLLELPRVLVLLGWATIDYSRLCIIGIVLNLHSHHTFAATCTAQKKSCGQEAKKVQKVQKAQGALCFQCSFTD